MDTGSMFDAFSEFLNTVYETSNKYGASELRNIPLNLITPYSYSIDSTLKLKKYVLENIDKQIKEFCAKADEVTKEIEARQKIVADLKSKIKVELPTIASLEVEAQAVTDDPVKQLTLVRKYIEEHLNSYYGATDEVKLHERIIKELERKKKVYMDRLSELSKVRQEYVPVNEDTVKTTTIDPKNMPKYDKDTCAKCGKCGGNGTRGTTEVPDEI